MSLSDLIGFMKDTSDGSLDSTSTLPLSAFAGVYSPIFAAAELISSDVLAGLEEELDKALHYDMEAAKQIGVEEVRKLARIYYEKYELVDSRMEVVERLLNGEFKTFDELRNESETSENFTAYILIKKNRSSVYGKQRQLHCG